jgi:hypothetical protein
LIAWPIAYALFSALIGYPLVTATRYNMNAYALTLVTWYLLRPLVFFLAAGVASYLEAGWQVSAIYSGAFLLDQVRRIAPESADPSSQAQLIGTSFLVLYPLLLGFGWALGTFVGMRWRRRREKRPA